MDKGNFKIKVKENISSLSINTFGEVGTIHEVKYGVLKDLGGYEWCNDSKGFKSIEDINKTLSSSSYQTLFELVEEDNTYKEFTKQDLKDGMVVELNNGQLRFLFNESLINKNGYIPFDEHFNNELIYNNNVVNNYTIKRVYTTKGRYFSNLFDELSLNLIWERKEEPQPKEMTIEEIEKALGYSVKIIK